MTALSWQNSPRLIQGENALKQALLDNARVQYAFTQYFHQLKEQINQQSLSFDDGLQLFSQALKTFVDGLNNYVSRIVRNQFHIPDPYADTEIMDEDVSQSEPITTLSPTEQVATLTENSERYAEDFASLITEETNDLIAQQEHATTQPSNDHIEQDSIVLLAGLKAINAHDNEGVEKAFETWSGIIRG